MWSGAWTPCSAKKLLFESFCNINNGYSSSEARIVFSDMRMGLVLLQHACCFLILHVYSSKSIRVTLCSLNLLQNAVLGILVVAGIVLLPELLPIAATSHAVIKTTNSTSKGSFDDLDKLSMGHIQVRTNYVYLYIAQLWSHHWIYIYILNPWCIFLWETGGKSPIVGICGWHILGLFCCVFPLMEGI